MGSPAIFSGSRSKLLTSKGLLLQSGATIDSDGPKNYVKNPGLENGTTAGYSLANTTFSLGFVPTGVASPGNAFSSSSGGTAATNLALSTVSSGQLSGAYSLALTATSTGPVGGDLVISDAFTVDLSDRAKVIQFKFNYKLVSGTGLNFSGTISNNTFAIFIYDVSAAAWIQPAGWLSMTQSSGVGIASGTFQTNVNSSQYQIAIINTSGFGVPFVMYFDDFFVGPQPTSIGAVMTDWQPYAPTWTAVTTNPTIGNGAIVGAWRRAGDSVEVFVSIYSGTTTTFGSGQYFVSLPTNFNIDASKISIHGNRSTVGIGTLFGTAVASASAVIYNPGTGTNTFGAISGGGWSNTTPGTWSGSNQSFEFQLSYPVVGWSSNVQMSNDSSTQVLASRASVSSGVSTSALNSINFDTVEYDSNGSITTSVSAWKYTAQISGFYRITTNIYMGATTSAILIYKNGALFSSLMGSVASTNAGGGSLQLKLNAGDYIDVRPNSTSTPSAGIGTSNQTNYVCVERLSGPAVVAATETVAARYTNTGGFSIPNNAVTTITGWVRDFDSHGFVSTNGVATIPVSGRYRISATMNIASGAMATGSELDILVTQTGSNARTTYISQFYSNASVTTLVGLAGSDTLSALAGDTISIQAYQNTGGARTLGTTANQVHWQIERVGN